MHHTRYKLFPHLLQHDASAANTMIYCQCI